MLAACAIAPRLLVLGGVPEGAQRVHPMRSRRMTVGRAQGRDVQLPASSLVSRLHFTIERHDDDTSLDGASALDGATPRAQTRPPRFFLVDESFNGVFVDNERAPKREQVELRDGALLTLGTGVHHVEPITLCFRVAAGALDALDANEVYAVAPHERLNGDGSPARARRKLAAAGTAAALTLPTCSAEQRPTCARIERHGGRAGSPGKSSEDSALRRFLIEQPSSSPQRTGRLEEARPQAEPAHRQAQCEAGAEKPLQLPLSTQPLPTLSPVRHPDCGSDGDGDEDSADLAAALKRARASPRGRSPADNANLERSPAGCEESAEAYPGFVTRAKRGRNAHAAAMRTANKKGEGQGSLASEFGAPPFSVLDGRSAAWRERRSYWVDGYGIQSEQGRPQNLLGFGGCMHTRNDTSVFDPMLCELVYRWWAPPSGSVLDPFAGGSVRAIVAARLGLAYFGVELSEAQIKANKGQAARIGAECAEADVTWRRPKWLRADARELDDSALDAQLPAAVDLVFTCPPYYDLEVYSDDKRDLSNAPSYAAFLKGLDLGLGGALRRLRFNRFACVVVGELRDRRTGLCRNFVSDTIAIAQRHGAHLYNSAVLLTPCNTAPMRARNTFALAKLTSCHQSVLVFWKGDSDAGVPSAGLVPNQAISWE